MDWESIIKRGVESDELDYKSAQNWNKLSRTGRAKFARHCMALANTKGGYVVIGVSEDAAGKPSVFTGMTEEESLSFDPSEIGNFVNRFSDPQVEFTVERPVVDGKQYVVLDIKRFSQLPHVCTGGCDHELQQGVFYIRTTDASSRPAYRASEIHALIQRAMRNQRELLGRMIRGLLYENHAGVNPADESQSRFDEEIRHSRGFFQKFINPQNNILQLEFTIRPSEHIAERFSLSDLRLYAEEACKYYQDALFIRPAELRQAYFTNVSLRYADNCKVWQFYNSGLFHFQYALKIPDQLSYSKLCDFTAEIMDFTAELYAVSGFNEEHLNIQLILNHTENLKLQFPHQDEQQNDMICRIPEIKITKNYSAADFISGHLEHTATLIRNICERFNVSDGKHKDLEERISQHLNHPEQD